MYLGTVLFDTFYNQIVIWFLREDVIDVPRQARRFSRSGYMHVIVRGIGRQILFEEREDYLYYLKKLEYYSRETGISIVAYCLMENHVHLLVHDKSQKIGLMMKKLGVCYSGYFNRKYDRTGHLFQDRYLSEAIDNENYFRIVFRYILMNPQKAGICPAFAYEWSSISLFGDETAFIDTVFLADRFEDYEHYKHFICLDNDDICMEYEPVTKDDEWAKAILERCLGSEDGTVLQQYDRQERDEALRQLKASGLTIKKLERLTGINRGVIQRA